MPYINYQEIMNTSPYPPNRYEEKKTIRIKDKH